MVPKFRIIYRMLFNDIAGFIMEDGGINTPIPLVTY